jgi:hypothetical protein
VIIYLKGVKKRLFSILDVLYNDIRFWLERLYICMMDGSLFCCMFFSLVTNLCSRVLTYIVVGITPPYDLGLSL